MELLASKQQQAASSKQQASCAGPFLVAEQKGSQNPRKKCYHAIRDGFAQLSQEQLLFRSDPHVVGNNDLLGFWPVLGRGHLEKFRARAENRKTQFPGAKGTFGRENPSAPDVSPKNCATFLHFAFWPTGPPRAGNRKILVF